MSFNQTIFNRGVFNLSESANAQWLDIEAYENVDAFAGVSKNIFLVCIPNEKVGISIHGTAFKAFDAQAHEVTGYNVALEGTFWIDVHFNEKLTQEIHPSVEIRLSLEGHEQTDNIAPISSEVRFLIEGLESLGEKIIGSREYHTDLEGNEHVSQVTSAVALEEKACVINVTLKPGEHLIVDANNYNVLIDGKNFIHAQKGDWLDEISRETYSITLSAAAGEKGLSAHILYTERFL